MDRFVRLSKATSMERGAGSNVCCGQSKSVGVISKCLHVTG